MLVLEANSTHLQPQQFQLDVLKILRIILYFYIVVKVLEILLSQKRKTSAKDRNNKKLLISHQAVIPILDRQQLIDLEITFKNTLTNIQMKCGSSHTTRRRNPEDKRILMIDESINQYYDHIYIYQEQEQYLSNNQILRDCQPQIQQSVDYYHSQEVLEEMRSKENHPGCDDQSQSLQLTRHNNPNHLLVEECQKEICQIAKADSFS